MHIAFHVSSIIALTYGLKSPECEFTVDSLNDFEMGQNSGLFGYL